jgi:hypothetical protein
MGRPKAAQWRRIATERGWLGRQLLGRAPAGARHPPSAATRDHVPAGVRTGRGRAGRLRRRPRARAFRWPAPAHLDNAKCATTRACARAACLRRVRRGLRLQTPCSIQAPSCSRYCSSVEIVVLALRGPSDAAAMLVSSGSDCAGSVVQNAAYGARHASRGAARRGAAVKGQDGRRPSDAGAMRRPPGRRRTVHFAAGKTWLPSGTGVAVD